MECLQPPGSSSLPQYLARYDDALYLRSSFADRAKLRVAPVFLRRVIFRVAIAAMNLDRFLANAHAYLRSEELGHRRFFGCLLALVLHPGGAIHQQPRGIDLRGHVRQLELDGLKL